MDILNKDSYIKFLECINKIKDLDLLYESLLEIISKTFNAKRVQVWSFIKDANEYSISHEYCLKNEPSMIKFRIPRISFNTKKTSEGVTILECLNINTEKLKNYNINSITGVELKLESENNEYTLILVYEAKNKSLIDPEISFLIKLKEEMESGVNRLQSYLKSIEITKKLYKQNENLREQDRLRTNFINNISHELRTPLSSILGFSKMLATKNDISENTNEIALQILQAGSRLSSLITDFLEINKITTEGWLAHFEPTDIGEILKKSVEEFISLNKNHNITYSISDNYPIFKTDPKLVRQVLDNLISNAVKYSPNGGRIIVILEVTKDKKEINVSVCDEGIGISKEEAPKIFDRLFRSSNPKVEKIQGTGLGLTISKEIITTLGGKIELESELNKGSKFTFTLPIV